MMIAIYDPSFSMPLHIDGFAALIASRRAGINRAVILDNCDTLRIADLRNHLRHGARPNQIDLGQNQLPVARRIGPQSGGGGFAATIGQPRKSGDAG